MIILYIDKLISGTYNHLVANIVVDLGPMIVSLDQLKYLFFAEIASKQILMEVGK